MTYPIDNRWSPGASDDNRIETPDLPTDSPAMYSARWIDMGDGFAADVVPDRQGFAAVSDAAREALISELTRTQPGVLVGQTVVPCDVSFRLVADPGIHVQVRRAGGYYYVDAWTPA